jgi:hypothetical protein
MPLTGRAWEVRGRNVQATGRGERRVSEWPDATGHRLPHHGANPVRYMKTIPERTGSIVDFRSLVHKI